MTEPTAQPNYLIYARLSAEEEVRGGMSLDMQVARCQEYADGNGLHVAGVFQDYGFSGKNTRRPSFEAMRAGLPEVDGVIVWKLDRLSRRVRDVYNFLEDCDRKGKGFISVAERFDTTTAMGRGFLGIAAVFGQLEAEQVAERTREGNRYRAKEGIWLYQAPFGYDYSTTSKKLTPGERADDCVTVFRVFVETCGNYSATARRLNEAQLASPKGRGWSAQGVKDVITNPVYRGTIKYVDVEGTGEWPAIVPADLLAETDRLIKGQRRLPRGRTSLGRHPLSGRLTCHECGAPVIIQLRKPNGTTMLRCRSARHGLGCSQPGFTGKRLEELWLHGLEKAWAEEVVDVKATDLAGLGKSDGWVSPKQRERRKASLEAKRRRIIELRVEGHIDKEEMERRLLPIAQDEAKLAQMATGEDEMVAVIEGLVSDGIAPAAGWAGMTPVEQRRLVATLLRAPLEVEVGPERCLRMHAHTWLFAERWEAWETRRDLSRTRKVDRSGRLAYAVRARD
jgi:DNA invertase Pin-like site-specific DNA recombinase